jgi:hypothetical protein
MRLQWIVFMAMCLAALSTQLYLLNSDPVPNISQSVGAYVDEGLNTCQARNYVNFGRWGFEECDNLVKSPLYNGYLAAVFKTFGATRTVARLSILVPSFLFLILIVFLLEQPLFGILLVLFQSLQLHLFQYQHLALVESLANACIPLILFMLLKTAEANTRRRITLFTMACGLTFSMVFLKVQYAYLLPLPILFGLGALFMQRANRGSWFKTLLIGFLVYIVLGFSFYGLWVLPHQEFIEMLRLQQGSDRFPEIQYAWNTFLENGQLLLWKDGLLVFQLAFLISLFGLAFTFRGFSTQQMVLIILSALWLLLELHKAFILWLPTRYALSLLAAQAWFMALVYVNLFGSERKLMKIGSLIVCLLLGGTHLLKLFEVGKNAQWKAQTIIERTAAQDFQGQKAIGVWSTTLVWNETVYLLPVWKDFLNDVEDPVKAYKPALLIGHQPDFSEKGVFPKEKLALSKRSRKVYKHTYGPFEIELFYLNVLGISEDLNY